MTEIIAESESRCKAAKPGIVTFLNYTIDLDFEFNQLFRSVLLCTTAQT